MKIIFSIVIKIIIITLITFLIANISIIYFKKYIFSEKLLPRSNLRAIPEQYQIYYQNTFNFKKNNFYTALIGDSHVFGLGDGYYDVENKKYSFGHFLKDKYPKENFVSFGLPGVGVSEPFFFFERINQTKIHSFGQIDKIFYFIYEGNDLEDNVRKGFNLEKFNKIFLFDAYFPLVKIAKNIKDNYFKKKKERNNKIVNTYFILGEKKNISTSLQSPPFELTDNELKYSLNLTFKILNKFKKFTDNIYIIYIPSPATVLDLEEPIVAQRYFPDRNINNSLTKQQIIKKNKFIVEKIQSFSDKNQLKFYDLTQNLKKYSKIHVAYGPKDFKHPRKNVYEYITEIISEEFLITIN